MIFYEHRPSLIRKGPPRLVTREKLDKVTGFQSIFGFPDDTRAFIKKSKSTKGIGVYKLYADTLFLDFDDAPKAFLAAAAKLDSLGLSYLLYETGNRGHHIHIAMQPVYGYTLPQRMKLWVKDTFHGADHSIYKPTGIFRLPNTIHEKTHKPKKLLRSKSGALFNLPDRIPANCLKEIRDSYDKEDLSNILTYMLGKIIPYDIAGRNNHCFKIAATCRDLGITKPIAQTIVETWNSGQPRELETSELTSVINSAYGGT